MDSMVIRSVVGRDVTTYTTTTAQSGQVPPCPQADHDDEFSMRSAPKAHGWHRLLDPAKLGLLTLTALFSGFVSLEGMVKHICTKFNTLSNRGSQESPLLGMPVELRIMIYDLVLQDTLDDMATQIKSIKGEEIIVISPDRLPPFLPSSGALALLQTSRQLRVEGIGAMRPLVKAKIETLDQALAIPRNRLRTEGFQMAVLKECLTFCDAITDARRFLGTLVKLAHPGLFLRGSGSDTIWSEFTLGQKIVAAKKYYRELPREEQLFLDGISSHDNSSHKWAMLVTIIDRGR